PGAGLRRDLLPQRPHLLRRAGPPPRGLPLRPRPAAGRPPLPGCRRVDHRSLRPFRDDPPARHHRLPEGRAVIRVAVADDSAFIRRALARILSPENGIELQGAAASGEELLDHLDRWRPDAIVLDLSMPGMGGLATLDRIMATRPTPVLILSTHSKRD